MSNVVRMCPYRNIQMSQVVKCVRHTNDRTNDHTNESLPIILFITKGRLRISSFTGTWFLFTPGNPGTDLKVLLPSIDLGSN